MDSYADVHVIEVGVIVFVDGRAQTHDAPTQRVDHVAKRYEVDGDVAVKGQAGDLAHLVFCSVTPAVGAGVLGRDAADDARVRHFVRRVDLLRPEALRVGLRVHVHGEVARDGGDHAPVRRRPDR